MTIKTITLEEDGTLVIVTDQGVTRRVDASQIAEHRRDPELEAALPADVKAAIERLPVPK